LEDILLLKLVLALENLYREAVYVERYNKLVEVSSFGSDCQYAKKALQLFESEEYEHTKENFLECLKIFREIEGDSFGRQ